MAINYVKGEMLADNLLRGGSNLSIETGLLYVDVNNNAIGINTETPGLYAIDINGNANVVNNLSAGTAVMGGLTFNSAAIASTADDLILTSVTGQVTFASDVKFTASNANIVGPGRKAALTVATTATTNVPYNLTNILPSPSISFDGSAGTEVPAGMFMTADGLTVFYVNAETPAANVDVYQTTLGIAFDMSSAGPATFTTVTGGIGTEAAHGITFNPNGLEMYISKYITAGVATTVEKFTLSIAFDLTSTVTYIGNITLNSEPLFNFAPSYSSDGLKAYLGGVNGGVAYVVEYDLSPAYDLTTAVFNARQSVAVELTHASNYITTAISADGFELLVAQYDGSNNQIARYDLGTAYDILTKTISATATPGTLGVVNSMYFKSDGTELYWLDDAGFFYQYDTDTVLGETSASLSYSGTENIITTVDGPEVSGQLILPNYTTATLPATTNSGGLVFDTDAKQVKVHNGTSWTASGSPGGVSAYSLTATTTDATQTEALDSLGSRLVLPDNTTWRFEVNIVARRTDANDEGGGYKFTGVIDRNTGVATTGIVGIVAETIDAEDNAAWFVTVDADTGNGSLRVQVTGEAAKTVKWVVFVRTVEVSN